MRCRALAPLAACWRLPPQNPTHSLAASDRRCSLPACPLRRQVLGYVYPAYRTYKVVQLPATRANDTLLRKWCCYWCLIAALTAVQPLLDTFLFWVRHERCGSLLLTAMVLDLGTLLSMLPLRPTKWVLAPWQVARQPLVR